MGLTDTRFDNQETMIKMLDEIKSYNQAIYQIERKQKSFMFWLQFIGALIVIALLVLIGFGYYLLSPVVTEMQRNNDLTQSLLTKNYEGDN